MRFPNWPECLADKDVATAIQGAVYEGYEQEQGVKTAIYRMP